MPTLRLLPDLEDAIREIPGIRAVSVVTNPKAVPTEVHVLASPGKPAKQLVRDVQSVALTRYDIDLDHRIVSVVQIGEEDSGSANGSPAQPAPTASEVSGGAVTRATDDRSVSEQGPARASAPTDAPTPEPADDAVAARPSIASLTVRTMGAEAEAMVTLAFGDAEFEATVSGSGAASHRHRLVASATLAALEPLLGLPTEVESATLVDSGVNLVALTVLVVTVPRIGPQSISGSAVVRGDEADAVARSVLDALNRRITG
ncbi:MAG: hypothetical protein WAN48_06875 [Actinomycetes bacterium]